MADLTKMDLYQLFDLPETCTDQELTTAFRKKALKCHPDKFPGDDEKKEQFLLIKRALELLADKQARLAYDASRRQQKVHQERLSNMDAKRKKFKEDLDRREQSATQPARSTTDKFTADRLNAEVERLRREGNRLVDEELENLHKIIEKEKTCAHHRNLIIKYSPTMAFYTDGELRDIFGKYGRITTIVNLPPKRALIEFNESHVSKLIESEKGSPERPFASVKLQKRGDTSLATTTEPTSIVDLTKPDLEDYEAMVFRKMAQHAASS
ncbi:unnamed protein product [Adineta ricciae]|uniref:J domain-containing protein n=1 Tax=Adineta ricciae TaxID=249248 RepID=A0A814L043_ADIRI|nr:unnamed protein product [Adineta ricciae]